GKPASSATYTNCRSGISTRASRRTVSPPTPESKTSTGRSLIGSVLASVRLGVSLGLALRIGRPARLLGRKIVERGDDAAQHLDLSLAEARTGQYRAQIVDHLRLLRRRAEIAAHLQRFFQVVEQALQRHLRRRRDLRAPEGEVEFVLHACLHPLIRHEQHRLGDIERGEGRIDREGHDLVGEADLFVVEPEALASEQDAGLLASSKTLAQYLAGFDGATHRLETVALARGRRDYVVHVGDGFR